MSPDIDDENTNCFEIIGDEVVRGIPACSTLSFLGGSHLPLTGDFGPRLYHGFLPRKEPCIESCEPGKAWAHRAFVYFELWRLDFGHPYFPAKIGIHPGAEWHNRRPFWRRGEARTNGGLRKDPDRAEIWPLESDWKLLLIDEEGNARILHSPLGDSVLSPVRPEEMAEYLFHRGCSAKDHNSVFWAIENMEKLQGNVSDDILEKYIEALHVRLVRLNRVRREKV